MAGIGDWVRVRFGWAANPTQALSGVTWTDESARVESVSIRRGRSTWPGVWPAGVCTVVLDATSGDLSLADATYGARLKPGRAVTVEGKDSGGTWRPLFAGHVVPRGGYKPTDQTPNSVLTVTAWDMLGTLSAVPFAGITPTATTPGAWIAASASDAGYGAIDATVDTGVSTLADDVEVVWTGSLAGFMTQVAASDGGELYCAKDGELYYDSRDAAVFKARLNTSQATISDDAAAGTVAALINPGVRRTWGDRLATEVTATDADGTVHTASVTGDIGYSSGSYNVGATFANASHAASLVGFWAAQTSTIDAWPASCSVLVAGGQGIVDVDHQDFACNRELRDWVTFEHTEPGRSQESHLVSIESIGHAIGPNGWRIDLTFQSTDPVTATGLPGWFVIGTSLIDGTDVLAY